MQAHKVTNLADGAFAASSLLNQPIENLSISGYEIHIGETL